MYITTPLLCIEGVSVKLLFNQIKQIYIGKNCFLLIKIFLRLLKYKYKYNKFGVFNKYCNKISYKFASSTILIFKMLDAIIEQE